MMNEITAYIEFNFKGEILKPSVVLDLDSLMYQHGAIPQLYSMLAKLNNIDSYSYEYEMMVMEEVQFSDAKGWVTDFVKDNHFDQDGFEQHWHEQQLLNSLTPLIKTKLDIEDIHQHDDLKSVLLAAIKAGKDTN